MMIRTFTISIFLLLSSISYAQEIKQIKVDQFGYTTNSQKIAIISQAVTGFNAPQNNTPADTLNVLNYFTDEIVFTDKIQAWGNGSSHSQSGDKVWWFNFSSIADTGHYYITDSKHNFYSHVFRISDDVYDEPLKHAVRMFYYQRCGVEKEAPYIGEKWKDAACHIQTGQDLHCYNVKDKSNASNSMDLSGGWHDAGDFNKYTTFTYSTIHQLLFAYEESPSVFFDNYGIPESGNGVPDLLDEVKVELDWLCKMQLPDGSVLSKVSVTDHQGMSPVSKDNSPRYYGEASSSATRAVASLFAHAYLIYKDIPLYQAFANDLKLKAINAWNYLLLNPTYSKYDNGGFTSANPERDEYDQKAYMITAAYFLYKLSGEKTYLDLFESNLIHFHAIAWNYWYLFEFIYERVLLDYCFLSEANPDQVTKVKNSFASSMASEEFLQAVNNKTDAYLAYLKDGDYTWGSNMGKSNVGNLFFYASLLQTNNTDKILMQNTALDYLHYIHGRNAIDKCFLTNMYQYGVERPANEMYHIWFGDATKYDNAQTSPNGPPPGFLTGGVNKNFAPATSGSNLQPPLNQPVQKSYKDWNTSYPENSWEITEPAIYYQAAYIHLLSKFASANADYKGNPKLEDKNDIKTSIQSLQGNNFIKIYPNPARNFIIVELKEDGQFIEIFDTNGKMLKKSILLRGTNQIMLENMPSGVYMAKLNMYQNIYTYKFVID